MVEKTTVGVTGATGVVAVVLLEWTIGWVAAASWTQSWSVVKRGHFRIIAWCTLVLGVLAVFANSAATEGDGGGAQQALVVGVAAAAGAYLLMQYVRTDVPGTVVGGIATVVGAAALVVTADEIQGWPLLLAAASLLAGSALLGAVTNGMLLGHWYLNQPGLKPWALARLTSLSLAAVGATALLGLIGAGKLSNASTDGAALGLPGFGDSYGLAFFLIWIAILAFTGVVVWMARRCVNIRSIQSATGLYYVALLTAGVSEFLVRYLMVNAA